MALIKCYECETEISTDAKHCLKCGAKNKYYKKSKLLSIGKFLLLLIIVFTIYNIYDYKINPTIPECNSSRAKKVFSNLIEKSPWALDNHIRVLDIIKTKEISSKSKNKKCEATLHLSNTTNKTYLFTFKKEEGKGGYLVRATPKK